MKLYRYVDFAQALDLTRCAGSHTSRTYALDDLYHRATNAGSGMFRKGYKELHPLNNQQAADLLENLFPLVKPLALELIAPNASASEIEALNQATCFDELPTLLYASRYEGAVHQSMETHLNSWWLVHHCLPLILPFADWALMFPNDVIKKEDGYYVKARARQSDTRKSPYWQNINSQVGFDDTEIGSIWHDGTVSAFFMPTMKFCVVADFKPARKGLHLVADEDIEVHNIFFADKDVKIDIESTIKLWQDSHCIVKPKWQRPFGISRTNNLFAIPKTKMVKRIKMNHLDKFVQKNKTK